MQSILINARALHSFRCRCRLCFLYLRLKFQVCKQRSVLFIIKSLKLKHSKLIIRDRSLGAQRSRWHSQIGSFYTTWTVNSIILEIWSGCTDFISCIVVAWNTEWTSLRWLLRNRWRFVLVSSFSSSNWLASFFPNLSPELVLLPPLEEVEQFASIFSKTDTGDAPRVSSACRVSLPSSKLKNHGNLPCLT